MRSRPDFENFQYQIVRQPVGAKARAWSKLLEAERRLASIEWLVNANDPHHPTYRTELYDALSAFLMNLEAVLQWLFNQWEADDIAGGSTACWILIQGVPADWDVLLKGLRTLRHFEAHISTDNGRKGSRIVADGRVVRHWVLPQLDAAEVAKRMKKTKHPSIEQGEIPDWNALAAANDALTILRGGLERMRNIVARADPHF